MHCLVCERTSVRALRSVAGLDYLRCWVCGATFLHPHQHPSAAVELLQYQTHRNELDDPGYRHFLSRLAAPLLERLAPNGRGLDYGCGPGPLLATMLREAGHAVALYDPFFQPDASVLKSDYDFVTCTEVAEHFHRPAEEFRRIDGLLKPGGWLGFMTDLRIDDARFEDWHYRRDPTHVVFYTANTLADIAERFDWECEIVGPTVALMRKRPRA